MVIANGMGLHSTRRLRCDELNIVEAGRRRDTLSSDGDHTSNYSRVMEIGYACFSSSNRWAELMATEYCVCLCIFRIQIELAEHKRIKNSQFTITHTMLSSLHNCTVEQTCFHLGGVSCRVPEIKTSTYESTAVAAEGYSLLPLLRPTAVPSVVSRMNCPIIIGLFLT